MMVPVILAHPHKGSFNHALAETVVRALHDGGHKVAFHDLYTEKFDPVLPFEEISRNATLNPVISTYCTEIAHAEGIIIIHPDWWGQPPAILKGWIDRVIRPGIAYRFLDGDSGEGVPEGLLKAKTALVFNTANTPERREKDVFGDPLERIWKDCIFSFCGVPEFHRRMFTVVVTSTEDQRKMWLAEAYMMTRRYFP